MRRAVSERERELYTAVYYKHTGVHIFYSTSHKKKCVCVFREKKYRKKTRIEEEEKTQPKRRTQLTNIEEKNM